MDDVRDVADRLEGSWPTTSGRCRSTRRCSSSSAPRDAERSPDAPRPPVSQRPRCPFAVTSLTPPACDQRSCTAADRIRRDVDFATCFSGSNDCHGGPGVRARRRRALQRAEPGPAGVVSMSRHRPGRPDRWAGRRFFDRFPAVVRGARCTLPVDHCTGFTGRSRGSGRTLGQSSVGTVGAVRPCPGHPSLRFRPPDR